MLVKAYIKNYMFHLPIDQNQLLNQVEEVFKKEINKSTFYKLNPIVKIEDCEFILVEKQRTNIFLLNLLLLVLNHNKVILFEEEFFNQDTMIEKLEVEIQKDLKGLVYEDLENEVLAFLNKPSEEPSEENVIKAKGNYLKNVEFNVPWLRNAQKELDGKE